VRKSVRAAWFLAQIFNASANLANKLNSVPHDAQPRIDIAPLVRTHVLEKTSIESMA
jgi:hypothetical protein